MEGIVGRAAALLAAIGVCFLFGLPREAESAPGDELYGRAGWSRLSGDSRVPEFGLMSMEGGRLDNALIGGKVVLVNFWATWCEPCKEEMPNLEKLYRKFDGEPFLLLAVTTDTQRGAIRGFMKETGLSFPVLLDEEKDFSAAFGVRGLPTSFLIGPDGRILARAVGPRSWDGPDVEILIRSLLND